MLSTADVAERLNLSEKTIRNLIEAGDLKAFKFGRVYRISEENFNEFIEKSKTKNENQKEI